MTAGLLAGARLQWRMTLNRLPDSVFPLITTPFFTIIFLAIVRDAGRDDLADYAVLAPVLIALWWFALFEAGGIITGDRWMGTLEGQVAAPVSFAGVLLGRIVVVVLVASISFLEVLLVARLLFGVSIEIHHAGTFALTLLATAFALSGTAVVMAGLFVLTRSSATWGNSLSYPFYVLGGVLVPVSFLPNWLEPVSSAIFLSWSADLLRASLDAAPVSDFPFRLAMIVVLGVAGFAAGALVVDRVLGKVLAEGGLEQA
jgi:ABC-2 type transport system permease protein